MDPEQFDQLLHQHPVVFIGVGLAGLLLGGRGKGWPNPVSYVVGALVTLAGTTAALIGWNDWPATLAFIAAYLAMTGWLVVGAVFAPFSGASEQ